MDSLADSVSCHVARFGIETSILMPGPHVEGIAHFPNVELPGESGVQVQYEALYGDALAANEQATRSLFPKDVVADVQAVADEALRIIDLPHGFRRYRSEVDFTDVGDRPINAAAVMRERALTRFGLGDLVRSRVNDTPSTARGFEPHQTGIFYSTCRSTGVSVRRLVRLQTTSGTDAQQQRDT